MPSWLMSGASDEFLNDGTVEALKIFTCRSAVSTTIWSWYLVERSVWVRRPSTVGWPLGFTCPPARRTIAAYRSKSEEPVPSETGAGWRTAKVSDTCTREIVTGGFAGVLLGCTGFG